MLNMEKIALIYDFDFTLCSGDAPTFNLFPLYGLDTSFYDEINEYGAQDNMEGNLTLLYYLYRRAKEQGKPITKKILFESGKDLTFYPGVDTWFERINKFGKENGFEIEHYLISSGILEIIEGNEISKNFKKIFASTYHYDENGNADWPLSVVNYTNKTQFIFRINRGILNNIDDNILNGYFPQERRAVPYKNMIYIGDGFTDVPSMKTMNEKKGYAIAVYSEKEETAKKLFESGRSNCACEADYREGSKLDRCIKERILSLKNE